MHIPTKLLSSSKSTTGSLDEDFLSWRRTLEQSFSQQAVHQNVSVVDDDDEYEEYLTSDGFGGSRRRDPEADYAFGGRKSRGVSRPAYIHTAPTSPFSSANPSPTSSAFPPRTAHSVTAPVYRSYAYDDDPAYNWEYTGFPAEELRKRDMFLNSLKRLRSNIMGGERYDDDDAQESVVDEDEVVENIDEIHARTRTRVLSFMSSNGSTHSAPEYLNNDASSTRSHRPASFSMLRSFTLPSTTKEKDETRSLCFRTHRQWVAISMNWRFKIYRARRDMRKRWSQLTAAKH
ncbi:hypothetical protein SISNIDRAFT_460854 [Sistotremastrum niveocremeum HHB9708]|uniref:Uncharacterized protein n=1 Tax=Sistotremastrum niveocremeum HHB9708 TaxID=1314777 RepID=A0A164N8J2_9AGAM|nr:hypothetical protein SISNIDRAFT_460854 [Sistotremastrum niveocremeum HHB9708]